MRLLIAEDDSVSRLSLSAAVKRLGYEVTAAADGAAAWEAMQTGDYSVVISDWEMPVVDGAELCRRIRAGATDRYVYFILVATRGGKQRYLEGMDAGADDFIAKPVDSEELRARIKVAERILNLRHHVQRLEGLLPICSYCKRIEDPGKDWQPVEQYVSTRSEAQFSHGICPDCYQKHIQPQLDAL
jgi:sigma-B regulation protein RsbU (phosphoserine phosphatase)